jgi:hypothetical protein
LVNRDAEKWDPIHKITANFSHLLATNQSGYQIDGQIMAIVSAIVGVVSKLLPLVGIKIPIAST